MSDHLSQPLNFEEFSNSTKKSWAEQAQLDLKDTHISELKWKPFPEIKDLTFGPYNSIEDLSGIEYLRKFHSQNQVSAEWKNFTYVSGNIEQIESRLQSIENSDSEGVVIEIKRIEQLNNIVSALENFVTGKRVSFITSDPKVLLEHLTSSNIDAQHLISDKPEINTQTFQNRNIKRPICISSNSNAVETQLVEILNGICEVLDAGMAQSLDGEYIIDKTFIYSITGQGFFQEIAKLRTLRILARAILEAYELNPDLQVDIISVSELYSAANYEPHENMIKSTYSAMSAVLGGCDALLVKAESENNPDINVANQLSNILKYEAHLGKVSDPAGGSYFVETLTHNLVKNCWERLKVIRKSKVVG